MQAVTGQPIKKIAFFEFSRVSPGDHPLTKKPEDSGYEIAGVLEFYYRRISAVKVSRGDQSLAKELEESGYEIGSC